MCFVFWRILERVFQEFYEAKAAMVVESECIISPVLDEDGVDAEDCVEEAGNGLEEWSVSIIEGCPGRSISPEKTQEVREIFELPLRLGKFDKA